jgi:outer membrane protein OmpA-like peptidoglycan-associated protein
MIKVVNKDIQIRISIEGHTNNVGDNDAEMKLSEQRVEKVKNFLTENGIKAERINEEFFGGKKLKVNKIDEINRRVEISLIKEISSEEKIVSKSNEDSSLSKPEEKKTRTLKLLLSINSGSISEGNIEIKSTRTGEKIFSDDIKINKITNIEVPENEELEILASADFYMPKKINVSKNDNNINIILDQIKKVNIYPVDNIYFEPTEPVIKKESYDILNQIVNILEENKNLKVEIRGHTDTPNQILSEQRAEAVEDYLIKMGLLKNRFIAKGFSNTQPLVKGYTEDAFKKNRRVEFVFFE